MAKKDENLTTSIRISPEAKRILWKKKIEGSYKTLSQTIKALAEVEK